jgi:hypothetical protein
VCVEREITTREREERERERERERDCELNLLGEILNV